MVTQIQFRKIGPILFFAQYYRGGLDPVAIHAIHRLTKGGRLPFVVLADFNTFPDAVQKEVTHLHATVIFTGQHTCVQGAHSQGSNIDYCIISNAWVPLVHSVTPTCKYHGERIVPFD